MLGPLVHASLALGLCVPLGIGAGDASLYFRKSLGVPFPLNILFGIPLYLQPAHWALG